MTPRIQASAAAATLAVTLAGACFLDNADACTRVLWNTNKLAVVSSRTMDWPESTEPTLTVFPRGTPRDGGRVGPIEVVQENPATWTSKYGSIVTTVYGIGAVDGLNEKGLAIHLLYLNAADFGA